MSDAFADLMQASPPERLVPGDPTGTDLLSQRMLRYSELFADAAQALTLVDLVWTGEAARAFEAEFELQPAAFRRAAAAFHDAGYALGSYAISLDSARAPAQAALEVFRRGVRAAHDAAALTGSELLPIFGPLDLRSQPAGMQDRLTGVEKLDAARAQLDRAGTDAARTLREAMAAAPRQVTMWEHTLALLSSGPASIASPEKVDFAAGGIRGTADMAILAASSQAGPVGLITMSRIESQLDDVEWKHGINPHSGFHTAGSIIIPAAVTMGVEGLAARVSARATSIFVEDVATKGLNAAPSDLSAFGNKTAPRAPRAVDMKVGENGMLVPQQPPRPFGASTFADPSQAPLKGNYHTILKGTPMPTGLAILRDGVDVSGKQAATHATIYATEPMTPEAFVERFLGLPWKYGGKK